MPRDRQVGIGQVMSLPFNSQYRRAWARRLPTRPPLPMYDSPATAATLCAQRNRSRPVPSLVVFLQVRSPQASPWSLAPAARGRADRRLEAGWRDGGIATGRGDPLTTGCRGPHVTGGTAESEGFAQYAAMQPGQECPNLAEPNMPTSLLARTGLFVAVHGGFFCGVLLLLLIGHA
jgi:hypothetical protein